MAFCKLILLEVPPPCDVSSARRLTDDLFCCVADGSGVLCTGAWAEALCVGAVSTLVTGVGCAAGVLGFVTVSAKLPISTPPVSSVKRKVSLFPLEGVNLSELVPVSIVKYVVPSAPTSVVLLTGPLTRMVLFGIAFETFTVTASPSLTLALAGLTVAFFAVAGVVTVGVVVVPAGGVAVLVVPAGGLAFVPAEGVVDVFVPADGVVAVPALGLSAGVVVFAALESGRILLVQLTICPFLIRQTAPSLPLSNTFSILPPAPSAPNKYPLRPVIMRLAPLKVPT